MHKLLKLFPEIKKQQPSVQLKSIKARIKTGPLNACQHFKKLMAVRLKDGSVPESLVKFKAKRAKQLAERMEFVRILDEIKDVDFLKKLLTG